MPVERPLREFVTQHILVDPLVADPHRLSVAQPAADLFRTPLVAQELVDQMPRLGGNAHVALRVTPSQHEALRLLRALPTSSPIGLYFATDSGGMDSNDTGNLRV